MERSALRRGFALAEAAAAAAVVALLAALLLVAAGESRRQSGLGGDLANLRRIGVAAGAYGGDHADLVFGFSWRAGVDYDFGGVATTDMQAAANQAVDLIRRRTGRVDLTPISGWIPHLYYSPLILADYLDQSIPSPTLASPADRLRLLWQSDPEDGYYALDADHRPSPLGDDNANKRWPYSSSYTLPPAFWSADAGDAVYQTLGDPHDRYSAPPNGLFQRRLSDVAHPGQKAMMYDRYQRHFGPREAYFGYAEARVPVLRADHSASVVRSADSNLGFYPPSPSNPNLFTRVLYSPRQWEPPALNGLAGQLVNTYYQFTRAGLRGRDFNGPEVPWTP